MPLQYYWNDYFYWRKNKQDNSERKTFVVTKIAWSMLFFVPILAKKNKTRKNGQGGLRAPPIVAFARLAGDC